MTGKKNELCPYCSETCSTNWNLKVHIQRKHPREAGPVKSGSHSTITQFIPDMNYIPSDESHSYHRHDKDSYHQTDPNCSYFSELNSDKVTEEFSADKKREAINNGFLETYLQMAEMINMVKQLQPTSGQPFGLGVIHRLFSGINLPPSSDLQNSYNLMQYMLSNNKRIIGFQGRICHNCFSYWADPVFNDEGERKPFMHFKSTHKCENKKVEDAINVPDVQSKKNHLHNELIDLLVLIASCLTFAAMLLQSRIYLIAEEIDPSSYSADPKYGKNNNLQPPDNYIGPSLWIQEEYTALDNIRENHWAYRVIKVEHEKSIVINHDELIDFVKMARATFGVFRIKTADGVKRYFLMYIAF